MGKNKRALIFGSRPSETWEYLRPWHAWPDSVIAADGGVNCAAAAGFRVDYYIGDGDSGGRPPEGVKAVVLPEEKDVTDLEAAYNAAVEMGIKEIILTACSGGRADHYLAALGLLETACRSGIHAVLLDESNRIEFLLPGQYRLSDRSWRYFSLCPVDEKLVGLTIRGAKYILTDRTVPRGSSLTISNELLAVPEAAEVSWTDGACFLIYSR